MPKKEKTILRPENEEDINDFLKQVELIHQSSYLQVYSRKKHNIKLKWEKDKGLNITSSSVASRESVEAFLMRMRPIIVYEERLYLGKVITYLIRNAVDNTEKETLEKLQQLIIKQQNKRIFSITVENKEYNMTDFVWLYLYGKYFHLDKNKQKVIQQFEAVFGPLAEFSALSQIEAYAGWALITAKYIKDKRLNDNKTSKV